MAPFPAEGRGDLHSMTVRRVGLPFGRAVVVCALFALPANADDAKKAEASGTSPTVDFKEHVAPLLAKYCFKCHGEIKPKAGLNLSAYSGEQSVQNAKKTWEKVRHYVESHEMPPEDRPQPSAEEAERITSWIVTQLSDVNCQGPINPGRVTLRRLNMAEYTNTIRDLLGINFKAADDFPSDDVGYGFDNIGDVLTLPPLLLEKYMAAAESIAQQAIVGDDPSDAPLTKWEAEKLDDEAGGKLFGKTGRILESEGEIGVLHTFPSDGEYVVRVRGFGQQAGREPVRMAVKIGGETSRLLEVTAEEDEQAEYQVRSFVQKGEKRVAVAFLNDFYDPENPDPKKRDRNLVVDSFEIVGPVGLENRALPESHRRIIFRAPTRENRVECARAIVEKFALRAYRRPPRTEDLEHLLKLVELAEQNGDRFEKGIQLAVQAVLVSPSFLFRIESDQRLQPRENPPIVYLSDYSLASRLSYFLWSSMPDDELFALAEKNMLRNPANYEAQIKRMLHDPKSRALVENFAGQWLQLRNLKLANPDPERFPAFNDALRADMVTETELFFGALMREDRSLLEFVDADFTFLNERLADHYGIPDVQGDYFRRVALVGDQRGGLITQASILTVTSNPTRTSPVKRGKWILEQILGTPPPPPPPDVPELKEEKELAKEATLRERMEQHRADPNCATCHSKMDPLGFGLENFDAVGAWREREGKFPIDASGVLPTGQTFQGPKQLKAILKTREQDFVRCLTEKMLVYALGRGLEYDDKCAVDQIVDSLAKDDYRFSRLVIGIASSDPFQKRLRKGGLK
jgi:Protein of unknown function (DUF1592)/Protein of unknown function (DUF1588)/Protein of unknown function (DUF1587)/Protein of unknown function (DUF1585)/Protein of unknown function (DUF1595)/Ca-dependent carbohydrate-binding module xylan-binding/Planctomycete cytochrome C